MRAQRCADLYHQPRCLELRGNLVAINTIAGVYVYSFLKDVCVGKCRKGKGWWREGVESSGRRWGSTVKGKFGFGFWFWFGVKFYLPHTHAAREFVYSHRKVLAETITPATKIAARMPTSVKCSTQPSPTQRPRSKVTTWVSGNIWA